jgi:endo-1,4-beta-xylanase
MKKRILALFLTAVMLLSLLPATVVTATVAEAGSPVRMTIRSEPNGRNDWQFRQNVNGWDVEVWTQHQDWSSEQNRWVDIPNLGHAQMVLYEDGSFSCEWERSFNSLFRTGRGFPRGRTVASVGDISINYNVTNFTSTNTSYLCVYGWTWHNNTDTMIEWYIVDDWHPNWRPGGSVGTARQGYTHHGTQVIDGETYDIYTGWRINQPSIAGNRTFLQIFSVNQTPRRPNRGVISVSQHFAAWESRIGTVTTNDAGTVHNGRFHGGLELYEVSFTVEGFGGRSLSNGVGRVESLCLIYGGNSICTRSGCHHCDGTIPAPVCGVNGHLCGTCATCAPPPPECTCAPDRAGEVIYTMQLSQAVVDTLNVGAEPVGGLQRSGEPRFNFGIPTPEPGSRGDIQITNRTNPWYALDVLLGDLVTANGNYRITVEGRGGANALELIFPLDAAPWEEGRTTGTAARVSMNFGGAPVDGQELHRIRVRTANDSTSDFAIDNIVIERLTCTCGEVEPPPKPTTRVEIDLELALCCAACGETRTFITTRLINAETNAVLVTRRTHAKKIGTPACAGGRSFSELLPFNAAASVVES